MGIEDLDGLLRSAALTRGLISFAGGLPAAETFPRRALAKAASAAMLDLRRDPLQYQWPEGRWPLRALIAARLRARGADVTADDVVVTNGAQDALALALDVLAPKAIQVDRASYPAALDLFRSRGCVPRCHGASALRYVMPALSNPHGQRMSSPERRQALDASFIIEDDAYADLLFDASAPRPLIAKARDRVFYVGTFSKTLSPGLRVGWLVPPRDWLSKVRDANARRDLHAGGIAQAIVEKFVLGSDFEKRLEGLRAVYKRRCERMLSCLDELPHVRFTRPVGGFSVWLETDLHVADDRFLRSALREGVVFDPGVLFLCQRDRRHALSMRLSFSAVAEARMASGIARLGRVLELSRRSRAQSSADRRANAPRPKRPTRPSKAPRATARALKSASL